MTDQRTEWQFPAATIGRRVIVFPAVDSTNAVAADWPADDPADGLALIALDQTAGRGRHGRVWRSRPGSSLLLSVIVCPPAALRRPVVLTAWAAAAVAGAVAELAGADPRVKWPNDVLVGGQKVCGILIDQGRRTVVGLGLNLNQTADEFRAAGLPDGASLRMLCGREFELRAAAAVVLRHLDAGYARLLAGDRGPVEAAWAARLGLVGRPVVVEFADGTTGCGVLRSAGFDGLELEDAAGVRKIVPETVGHIWGADRP